MAGSRLQWRRSRTNCRNGRRDPADRVPPFRGQGRTAACLRPRRRGEGWATAAGRGSEPGCDRHGGDRAAWRHPGRVRPQDLPGNSAHARGPTPGTGGGDCLERSHESPEDCLPDCGRGYAGAGGTGRRPDRERRGDAHLGPHLATHVRIPGRRWGMVAIPLPRPRRAAVEARTTSGGGAAAVARRSPARSGRQGPDSRRRARAVGRCRPS